MPGRYLNLVRFRDGRSFFLFICLTVSLVINFLLLMAYSSSLTFNHGDLCMTSMTHVGVRKVMEYIDREREVDSVVRDAFVNKIWRCMKDTDNSVEEKSVFLRHISLPSLNVDAEKAKFTRTLADTGATLENTAKNRLNKTRNIELFLSMPIINPHEYVYIFNQSNACSDANLKYIIAVPSSPGNFENRLKMRVNSAGKFVKDSRNNAKLLFFLGNLPGSSPDYRTVQYRILQEQQTYGDIIQSTFIDTYRNITKKEALILKWSRTFCEKSKFIIRVDDDLRVNLSKITHALEDAKNNKKMNRHFILGNLVKDWGPVRSQTSKYYTSVEEYPYKKLPDFILGGCMGYSVSTADLLFKAYVRLSPFWLDDVFLTAMCAPRVGVDIYNSSAFSFEHWKW